MPNRQFQHKTSRESDQRLGSLPLPGGKSNAIAATAQAACAVAALLIAAPACAADPAAITPVQGLVTLDYQTVRVNGYPSIDLVGFHFLAPINDWLYLGVGGHAPLFKGEYGGLMAFDATVHAQRRLIGNVYGVLGASLGGGGGGKTVAQSKVISGSSGFTKAYAGLGYDFKSFAVGLQYSRLRFVNSALDGSQVGLQLLLPFSYLAGPYENAGQQFAMAPGTTKPAGSAYADRDVASFGLDNLFQIRPQGSVKQTVNLVDVQYSHFIGPNQYVLFGGSVGYHGIVAYNQAYAGLGYHHAFSERFGINAQLALGSGGYAPERIDTGPGLLIHPKVSAEYLLSDKLGIAVSGGYLYAPRGSSRNATLGASLVYHVSPVARSGAVGEPGPALAFTGHRFHLYEQTQYKVRVGGAEPGNIKMLSVQVDNTLGRHLYVPVQGSIAMNSYFGLPGYGELLAGIGVQTLYAKGDRLQGFAQMLVGTNVHGLIAKPMVGLNLGLSDSLALYAQLGSTASLDALGVYPKEKQFRSYAAGLGLTYRFSLPDR